MLLLLVICVVEQPKQDSLIIHLAFNMLAKVSYMSEYISTLRVVLANVVK